MAKGKYLEWLETDGLLLLEGWARDGLTDEQIAKNIGINIATLYRWVDKYCEIREALKRGKAPVDLLVENALLKRALGFEYEEVTTEISIEPCTDKKGKPSTKEVKHIKKTKKFIPPDTTAQIFWLKNRRPDKWRDKRDENITISDFNSDLIDEVGEAFRAAAKNDETRSN